MVFEMKWWNFSNKVKEGLKFFYLDLINNIQNNTNGNVKLQEVANVN